MPWIHLLAAAALEIVWAVGLKYTAGFTRFWPSLITGVALFGSVGLLAMSTRVLPVGTAYAVWTGLGAFGTLIAGIALFGEPATAGRLACAGLILAGVIGLKVA